NHDRDLIPFPPRLVDLQPFSERECSDFLFSASVLTLREAGTRSRRASEEKPGSNSNRHDLLPVTVKPGEASSPSPSAPIPNPERGCTTGASAIFPNLVSSGLRQPATGLGRSPTDRLNRD